MAVSSPNGSKPVSMASPISTGKPGEAVACSCGSVPMRRAAEPGLRRRLAESVAAKLQHPLKKAVPPRSSGRSGKIGVPSSSMT
eukprot:5786467-Amphidinium_carterae.1